MLAIAKPLHRRIVVGAECWPRGTTVSPGRPHFLTNGLIQPAQHIQDLRRVLAELDVDSLHADCAGCVDDDEAHAIRERIACELLAHKPVEAQSGI